MHRYVGPKTKSISFSTFYPHVPTNNPFPPRPFPNIHKGKVSGKPWPLRSIGWPTMPSLSSPQKATKNSENTGFCAVYWLHVIYYYVCICLLFYMKRNINWLGGFCPWTVASSTMGPNIFLTEGDGRLLHQRFRHLLHLHPSRSQILLSVADPLQLLQLPNSQRPGWQS